MQVDMGSSVTVRCVVRDEAQNLIDAGEQSIQFTVGQGEVIAGIESAVIGLGCGGRVRFVCPPEQAYGPYRPELVFETIRENLPPGRELAPGMTLEPGGGSGRFQLKVLELTENGARLDGNHPLAGLTLQFDLEVVDVASS